MGAKGAATTPRVQKLTGAHTYLDKEDDGSDAPERIRRAFRLRGRAEKPLLRLQVCGPGKTGDGPLWLSNTPGIDRPWWSLSGLGIARNRRVVAGVGRVIAGLLSAAVETLPTLGLPAAPLNPRIPAPVAANYQPARQDRTGQPEPDQAEPGDERVGTARIHLCSCTSADIGPGPTTQVYRPEAPRYSNKTAPRSDRAGGLVAVAAV